MKRTACVVSTFVTALVLFSSTLVAADGKAPAPAGKVDQIVNELISSKGDLNQRYDSRFNKDDKGIPVLVWAVSQKNSDAVGKLLKNGANPNAETMKGSGETALFEVAESMDIEVDAKQRVERCALTKKICELLIDGKADVNFKNKLDCTPLYKAATRGRDDLCLLMINKGADVNAQDKLGNTSLHQAAKYGCWKVVDLLLKSKANAGGENKLKKTPLKLAEERMDEKLHKEIKQKFGNSYYADYDYDKTIEILRKATAMGK
ncbi:MAG TPA: hypothetical protein DET40_06130 [Lentisphaeria bacterium]|nr:MAG: hypothetical protein A2X45_23270 [Lentisphaerae bacterium GWF2_50_93]HCE43104.1 hypothetical protein [Lentisphaeria bacterium]